MEPWPTYSRSPPMNSSPRVMNSRVAASPIHPIFDGGHEGVLQQFSLALCEAAGLLVEKQIARRFPRLVRSAGLRVKNTVPYLITLGIFVEVVRYL